MLLNNNLRQELFWTKKTHLAHLLYLIDLKEKIKTKYKVNNKVFEDIINRYMKDIDDYINTSIGDVKRTDTKKEDEDGLITVKTLVEQAKINKEYNIK